MHALVPRLAFFLAGLCLVAGTALAQRDRTERQRPAPAMSQDERQRMRQDMREVYRERRIERGARPERPRSLSPQEREKLRQDVQNANKALKR